MQNQNTTDKILQDILDAIKDNDLTAHELALKGYISQLCTVCWLWDCVGEYSHYEPSILGGMNES